MEKEENQQTTSDDHQEPKKETAKPEENLDSEIKGATDQEAKETAAPVQSNPIFGEEQQWKIPSCSDSTRGL